MSDRGPYARYAGWQVRVWEGEWAQRHFQIPEKVPRSQSRYFK